MNKIKVAIWGFGAMGQGIAEMLLNKEGVEIIGVCDLSKDLVGKPLSKLVDIKTGSLNQEDILISDNIDEVLKKEIDLTYIATDSFTARSYDKIVKVINAKSNVISTAEEMAYPYANEPELSKKICETAKENDVTVLGTGINPGFIMDLLAISLTGAMVEVDAIEVRRVNSLSPFGPTVMEEQGVGITLDEFNDRQGRGELAGHVGFKESIYMIADALGVEIEQFNQQMKPIVTNVDRKSKYGFARAGTLAGIDMTAQGIVKNGKFIDMQHPQQIEPHLEGTNTGDYISIKGKPSVNMAITPEIDGGLGTIAMCANMLPHVINAESGLKTMIDLPVPRAIMGDVRKLVKK